MMISRRPDFALGFRNVLADVVWLQAVQVAGNKDLARSDYDRLYRLLDAVANYDPRFLVPYLLGGLVLGESPDHAREALRTLDRGWRNHPLEWRLPFYMGYTWYFILGNPLEGGRLMQEASRLPGSPAYLPRLSSRMLVEAKAPETSLSFLQEMIAKETDPERRDVLIRRTLEVAAERDIQRLERAVEEYRTARRRNPGSLDDLVAGGFLQAIPEEPNGGKYYLSADGEVRSSRMKQRLKVYRQHGNR
jgi:tetratricopeptide (TPR) repeat protein